MINGKQKKACSICLKTGHWFDVRCVSEFGNWPEFTIIFTSAIHIEEIDVIFHLISHIL